MEKEAVVSKKRKFIGDGLFRAELNSMLRQELAEEGYSGLEVRVTPTRVEVVICASKTQEVIGERGRRIRELTAMIEKRFNMQPNSIELFVEKILNRGLSAIAQAELLRYKLIGGIPVRRACNGIVRYIMECGAQGCEVIVSGKLSGQRAKSLKIVDGQMINAGDACNDYVIRSLRYVQLRQGILGIKVRIMLPHDASGRLGPKKPLPDKISIMEPREEKTHEECYTETRIYTEEIKPSINALQTTPFQDEEKAEYGIDYGFCEAVEEN